MTLKDIDTKDFIFDPKTPNFLPLMDKEEEFRISLKGVSRKGAFTYMCLMYDPKSILFKRHEDSRKRKIEAGKIAGFGYNEKTGFSKSAIELMIGNNEKFNEAIAHYTYLSNNIYVQRLAAYEVNLSRVIKTLHNKFDPKLDEYADNLVKGIEETRKKIFGADETQELINALSNKANKISEILRIENISGGLDGWSKFGDYVPDKLEFIGDKKPDGF